MQDKNKQEKKFMKANSEIREHLHTIEVRDNKIEELSKQIDILKEQISSYESDNMLFTSKLGKESELTNDIEDRQRMVDELREKERNLIQQNESLKNQKYDVEREHNKALAQVQILEDRRANLESEVKDLK